jgi:hypothetical protein
MLLNFNCIIRFSFYVIRFLMFANASIMVWIVFYETLVVNIIEYFYPSENVDAETWIFLRNFVCVCVCVYIYISTRLFWLMLCFQWNQKLLFHFG